MQSKSENHTKGQKYEEQAALYLLSLGYEILERNYRFHRNEIDIIARDGSYIVFTEVKYRSRTNLGFGFDAVDARKQQRIRKVAGSYLIKQGLGLYSTPCRFDVISIDGTELKHFINAF